MEELNSNLKRFWETEGAAPVNSTPTVQIQEQLKNSIQYVNNMYRVCVPWIDKRPNIPDNYRMALQRLQNTEKKLTKS